MINTNAEEERDLEKQTTAGQEKTLINKRRLLIEKKGLFQSRGLCYVTSSFYNDAASVGVLRILYVDHWSKRDKILLRGDG